MFSKAPQGLCVTSDGERRGPLNGCYCVFGNSGILDSLKIRFFFSSRRRTARGNSMKRKYKKLFVNVKTRGTETLSTHTKNRRKS